MKEFIDKITSYNLFNHLLPGVLFAAFLNATTPLKLIQSDILVGFFVYYFLGVIVSRFGSLIIEPILKKSGFVVFSKYDDFVNASKQDVKIEVLSETNNMYRNICALVILSWIARYFFILVDNFLVLKCFYVEILSVIVLLVFLFAYKKQVSYIYRRVERCNRG